MKKNWPILLLCAAFIAIMGMSSYTYPSQEKQQEATGNSSPAQRVTQSQAGESPKKENQPEKPPFWRAVIAWPSGFEALAVGLTGFFIAWQALLTRQSIVAAETASRVELRAYIVVDIATGVIQDRGAGLKFQGSPQMVNTGKTPAHNVRWRTNCMALKDVDAASYSFPPGEKESSGVVMGVGQTMGLGIVHRDFFDSVDAEDVKTGLKGRGFYYWGVISYEDSFGDHQTTDFCHRVSFYSDAERPGNWKVNGQFVNGRNRAT